MLLRLQQTIKDRLVSAIKQTFEIELNAADIAMSYPPKTELGDVAFPVAFELAQQLKAATGAKQNPRQLAEKIRAGLGDLTGVSRVDIAGAGYLNFYLDRGYFLQSLAQDDSLKLDEITGGKLIVEHTSINPNKAAHIGHLRNAVLGDTIVRLLRATGETVEVHNYIDNTGVQVADVVVGFKYLENKTLEDVKAITEKFDYYCWDLYARVGKFYEESPENKKLRAQTLHDLEHNTGDTAILADYISQRILTCHLETMLRLGIDYELLPRESDILHLNFWATAFEKLKASGAIYFEEEGRSKGCWVMRAEQKDQKAETEAAESPAEGEEESQYEADKILVRSNGTVTYTGKDIAYHLWKLGQLGLDFSYRPFHKYPDDTTAWITTSQQAESQPAPKQFGNGVAYFNVIDVGQSYPQAYVKMGVKLLSTDDRIDRSAHLAYEKVVLTPASAKELGYELSEEESKRSQISMSGRKGLGVKADDLIDKLEEKARIAVDNSQEIARNKAEQQGTEFIPLTESEKQVISHQVAVAALRYFLLKYTRNSIIAFDFEEALAFQGESGPYIQYSIVRINGIFRKLAERGVDTTSKLTLEQLNELFQLKDDDTGWDGNYLWSIIYQASRLKDTLRQTVKALEPTHTAKYAYQLASAYSEFYTKKKEKKYIYPVLDEPNPERQKLLITLCDHLRQQLTHAAQVLGIEVPAKM